MGNEGIGMISETAKDILNKYQHGKAMMEKELAKYPNGTDIIYSKGSEHLYTNDDRERARIIGIYSPPLNMLATQFTEQVIKELEDTHGKN